MPLAFYRRWEFFLPAAALLISALSVGVAWDANARADESNRIAEEANRISRQSSLPKFVAEPQATWVYLNSCEIFGVIQWYLQVDGFLVVRNDGGRPVTIEEIEALVPYPRSWRSRPPSSVEREPQFNLHLVEPDVFLRQTGAELKGELDLEGGLGRELRMDYTVQLENFTGLAPELMGGETLAEDFMRWEFRLSTGTTEVVEVPVALRLLEEGADCIEYRRWDESLRSGR
ncbi:MAG: hypothetical protein AB7I50_24100 [Vicinamibacterales bacterium]